MILQQQMFAEAHEWENGNNVTLVEASVSCQTGEGEKEDSSMMTSNREIEQNILYYAVVADQGRVFRKVCESVAAWAAFILGLQFLNTGFTPFAYIYLPMSMVAPAAYWGALMVTLACMRILILIINGYWPHTHSARKWLSAAFIFAVWLPLAACFWWSFQVDMQRAMYKTYPGLAYSMFSLGIEFLIYYAHASFVYVKRRGKHE